MYGQSRKDVFLTLPVCSFESRKFESKYSGDATKRLRGLILYLPTANTIPLYIIRYKSGILAYFLCVYRLKGKVCAVVVYIITGVGRLEVAYPYLEAMREPERRDRRGEEHFSHVFFVSRRLVNK